MFDKCIKYLIRVLLFLLVVIILVSIFASRFDIDVEAFKENSFSLITIVGVILIIIFLIWRAKANLNKKIESIKPFF